MKYIFLTLFLLPLLAAAQEVTSDTTYHSLVDGNYFIVQKVVYATGEYEEKSRLIGDSTQYNAFLVTTAANEANALAAAAMTVIRRNQVRQRYALLESLYQSLTGVVLWRRLNQEFYPGIEGTYRLRYNGGAAIDMTTALLPNGTARLVDPANATWNIRIASPRSFSLIGWDGKNWDMYSEDGERWMDLDRVVILRKQ